MPIDILIDNKKIRLEANNMWKHTNVSIKDKKDITVLTDHFFINLK